LQTRDLSGSDKFVLTQESIAQMIGARRNSVSLVAHMLQQANFLHYSRGAYRDHQSGWPQQDFLRMLRNGQGPVRQIAAAALAVVSVRRAGEPVAPLDGIRASSDPGGSLSQAREFNRSV
jgi:hypothetical protein